MVKFWMIILDATGKKHHDWSVERGVAGVYHIKTRDI